jgi:Flp pilus assembly pilin Flp
MNLLLRFWHDESGALQSLETVLAAALLVLGVGAGMMAVRDKTNELYYDVATQIDQFKSANMPRVGVSNAEVEVVPTLGVGIQEATTANP